MAQSSPSGAATGTSDLVRTLVWKGLLTAKFNVAYYDKLEAMYQRRDQALRVSVGVTSPATLASLTAFGTIPGSSEPLLIVTAVLGLTAAILAVVNGVLPYQTLLTQFGIQFASWTQVQDQYNRLWLQIEAGGTVTLDMYQTVSDAASQASGKELPIPKNAKLLQEAKDEILQQISASSGE